MCQQCHPYCATCSDKATNCLSCSNNRIFATQSNPAIVPPCICPAGTFDGGLALCGLCHSSCATCKGGTVSDCLTCVGNKFLLDGICYDNCPSTYWGNASSAKCESCHISCRTCTDAASNSCLSCPNGLYIVRNRGECVDTCPVAFFLRFTTKSCEPCSTNCLVCDSF